MGNRSIYNMNLGWKFHDGDIDAHNHHTVHQRYKRPEWLKAGNNGLAYSSYDDTEWQDVDLPHDFVVARGEYDKSTVSASGFLKKGIVWYRKSFEIPEQHRGKRLFLQFDGIYRDCRVWFNGMLLGRHLGGYMGFEFEFTEVARFGAVNTVAVRVNANEYEGWWYEGGGIYRDVRLLVTQPIRIIDKEVYANPINIDVGKRSAKVEIRGAVNSGSTDAKSADVQIAIYAPSREIVATETLEIPLAPYETTHFKTQVSLESIDLWSLESRNLYALRISVESGSESDTCDVPFGIRKIKYSSAKGFELNDQTVKLKGACGHDDFAGVGTALTRPIMAYKIKRLMDMGCNAYRCSHNPPSPKFLELCDQMGFLVIDETRLPGIEREVMEDYINLIKRDRNHPSIIAWSMGNEEMAIHKTEVGVNVFKKMEVIGKKYDDSRPFLYAINADSDRIVDYDRSHGMIHNPAGINYFVTYDDDVYATMHQNYPALCLINTETTGMVSTREYALPYGDEDMISQRGKEITVWLDPQFEGKSTCYGSNHPVWGMTPEVSWKVHADRPYSAGLFLWTGFDYRGEVYPYDWPATISFYGLIDLCGFAKDWYYYLKANWTDQDVLHLLPHWNMDMAEGTMVKVWAFTNCDEAELLLNGKPVGKQTLKTYGHIEWSVPYEKGALEAIGYRDGIEILRAKRVTAKKATRLILSASKQVLLADNEDAAIVAVHLEDADGNMLYASGSVVDFSFYGPCAFLGTGNGDHFGMEHDKLPQRTLFAGRCIAIVQSTYEPGDITVRATCEGMETLLALSSQESTHMPYIAPASATDLESEKEQADADGGF